jgi:hypothetical protein
LNLVTLIEIVFAFVLIFLYTQMSAMEGQEGVEADPLMAELLLSPLAAFEGSSPALSTPGLQVGVFALGVVSVVLWAVLAVL